MAIRPHPIPRWGCSHALTGPRQPPRASHQTERARQWRQHSRPSAAEHAPYWAAVFRPDPTGPCHDSPKARGNCLPTQARCGPTNNDRAYSPGDQPRHTHAYAQPLRLSANNPASITRPCTRPTIMDAGRVPRRRFQAAQRVSAGAWEEATSPSQLRPPPWSFGIRRFRGHRGRRAADCREKSASPGPSHAWNYWD